MEFASVFFIWLFLPISLLLYYLSSIIFKNNTKFSNLILLIFSMFFYAWGGFKALLLLLIMTALNYGFGLWIDCFAGKDEISIKSRKGVYLASLLANILPLAFFKYFNMMVTSSEILISANQGSLRDFIISILKFEGTGAIQIRNIAMPLAISFVVFQSISYITDVYKHKISAEHNVITFYLYTFLFAQLVQGPIMRYDDLGGQIIQREHSSSKFVSGIRRFCYGLGKKVIIANTVGSVVNQIWIDDINTIGSGIAWLGVLLYTLQIYYDFSGYTDMAIGVGRMFGFEICENFDYPYTSLSIQEFWRRWHMSLSSWFRDYIYIPLGGNRKGYGRTLFNLFIVFLVTGIWHGANLTFILWGLLFAVFSIIERVFLGSWLKKNPIKPLNWLYTMFVVMMGWVLFRAPNLYLAIKYFIQLFAFHSSTTGTTVFSYLNIEVLVAILAGVLLSGIVQRPLKAFYEKVRGKILFVSIDVVVQLAIFAMAIILIISGSYNPSIYGAF
jgi:alginate O-acetyltransferase complex protein AlgI